MEKNEKKKNKNVDKKMLAIGNTYIYVNVLFYYIDGAFNANLIFAAETLNVKHYPRQPQSLNGIETFFRDPNESIQKVSFICLVINLCVC